MKKEDELDEGIENIIDQDQINEFPNDINAINVSF